MAKVSVVIVSYNTSRLLEDCLRSLTAQPERLQVIVVDNASTDGSPEMVVKKFPKVTLVRNQRNYGFAAANNQGFGRAKGEYIVMLNSDCQVPKARGATGPLGTLTGYLADHPEVGVVAPKLVNTDRSVQQSACWSEPTPLTELWEYTLLNRLWYRLFPTRRYPGKRLLTPAELDREQEVADLLGACLAFRRGLLKEVGQLDERFFMFLEETDFNQRVRAAGYRLRHLPSVTIIHRWGSSIDQAGTLTRRFNLFFPSLYAYQRKHHPWPSAGLMYLEALIGSALISVLVWLAWLPAMVVSRRIARSLQNIRRLYAAIFRWHVGLRSSR